MRFKHLISFGVAALILSGVLSFIDWKSAIKTFSDTDPFFLLTGLVLTILWPLVGAVRWQSVLRAFGYHVQFLHALNAIMIAFSANLFAPAKSGDLIKVVVMEGVADKKVLTSGVLAERMGDLFILGLLAAVSGFFLHDYMPAGLGVCIVAGVLIAIIIGSRIRYEFRQPWLLKVSIILRGASEVWVKKSSSMGMAMLWSFVNWALAGVQIWLFFSALGVDISLMTVMALFPITVMVSLLPITPGGLGVRESAFVLFFLPYAAPHTSIAASLGYFICNTGLTALFGVIFVHLHINKANTKPIFTNYP